MTQNFQNLHIYKYIHISLHVCAFVCVREKDLGIGEVDAKDTNVFGQNLLFI